jgi:uncharacterized phage protein gp47/JayE
VVDLAVVGIQYPTVDELHNKLLSDVRYAYAAQGITANVSKDSELWHRYRAYANRASIAISNGQLTLQSLSPLSAVGDDLTALAAVYGVSARPASQATGYVAVSGNAVTTFTIPNNFQCTSAAGIKYKTTGATFITAPYPPGSEASPPVQIRSVLTGEITDLDAGSIVTWDSAAIANLGQTATVEPGGIDGGSDADDEDELRSRLLRSLAFPAVGGNWAHVANLAEDASSAVEFVAVYETARGPSSYDIAIVGDADDPVLNSSVVDQVAAYVVAEMPGTASCNTTNITPEQIDVVLNAELSLPVHAGGAGGGWIDAAPWPTTADAATAAARITAVGVGTPTITVNSTAADPPTVGARFAIWNPTTEKMVRYTVTGVGGGAGAYVITVPNSADLSFVTAWMYCSADAELLQDYGDAFVAAVALLGPGEKTTNPDILQYARRKPTFDVERPQSLTTRALKDMMEDHEEILDLSYAARFETGTVVTRTTPDVPPTVANAPRQITLANFSIRRQV